MQTALRRIRFAGSVIVFNALTLLLGVYAFWPGLLSPQTVSANQSNVRIESQRPPELAPVVSITSGKPVRIVVPSLDIDLPVDDGVYNPKTQTWNISGRRAHFALLSVRANDLSGNTFIYGHNNNHVFGPLDNIKADAKVYIYTNNNLKFTYRFASAENLNPEDTTIFSYQGEPTLTVQTCTGNWNELRRMFHFTFEGVDNV